MLSDIIGECYTFKPCTGDMVDISHPKCSRKTKSNNNDIVPEEASSASSDCDSVNDLDHLSPKVVFSSTHYLQRVV